MVAEWSSSVLIVLYVDIPRASFFIKTRYRCLFLAFWKSASFWDVWLSSLRFKPTRLVRDSKLAEASFKVMAIHFKKRPERSLSFRRSKVLKASDLRRWRACLRFSLIYSSMLVNPLTIMPLCVVLPTVLRFSF
jgi:hypothetical protein